MPADFHGIDGLTHALKKVMEDSHGRTCSFDEVAEILSEILHQTEVRNNNVKKCLNGTLLYILYMSGDTIYIRLIHIFLDIYITNSRIGQLLHHAETSLQHKLGYNQQLKSISDDFHQLFTNEGHMQLLFEHLNACGEKLMQKLYNSKQLSISGAPRLVWDFGQIRVRGSSGSTGAYTKSFGVTQMDFQRRMRTEEEICRLKMPKVSRSKPPSMKSCSVQSSGWEPLMALADDMAFWNGPGVRSPMKKKSRVERKGEFHL